MGTKTALFSLLLTASHAAIVTGPPFNSKWFTSRTQSNLSAAAGTMTWGLESTDGTALLQPLTKTTVEVIITNLAAPVPLSKIGDNFNMTVSWRSTGYATNCDAEPWHWLGVCWLCVTDLELPLSDDACCNTVCD